MLSLLKALLFTAGPKYSWKKATLVILFSSTVFLSLIVCVRLIRLGVNALGSTQEAPTVEAIIQIGAQKGAKAGLSYATLPAGYLSEALDLSVDSPARFSQFDVHEGSSRLLASHVVADVKMKKIRPNLLSVDYVLRTPWAFLEDYTNTAIDPEGFFFPFAPFYSPRALPGIYLGEHAPATPWGDQMAAEHLALARSLIDALPGEEIERIDLSHYQAPTTGKREIVLTLKGGVILRVAPKNCVQQLTHYSILKSTLLKKGAPKMIVDLRIPDVAYIQRLARGS